MEISVSSTFFNNFCFESMGFVASAPHQKNGEYVSGRDFYKPLIAFKNFCQNSMEFIYKLIICGICRVPIFVHICKTSALLL